MGIFSFFTDVIPTWCFIPLHSGAHVPAPLCFGKAVVLTTDEGEFGHITFKQIPGQKETTADATTEAAVAGTACVFSVLVSHYFGNELTQQELH